jgi:hypothetical protein
MQHLIASYLIQNRACPAGTLGTLYIDQAGAVAEFTQKSITAPRPVIRFSTEQSDKTPVINYLASSAGIDQSEAAAAYDVFFEDLQQQLDRQGSAYWEGVGTFTKDAMGETGFAPGELPATFLPAVTAERVVHPQTAHTMLVGDKETTNTVMTEYFNEEPATRSRWWTWAIVIAAIALIVIFVYFNSSPSPVRFGNAVSYKSA